MSPSDGHIPQYAKKISVVRRGGYVGNLVRLWGFMADLLIQNAFAAAVYGRAGERILIAIIGGISIWLGDRLFSITTRSSSSAELDGKAFKLRLHDVAPGVFFCLFGVLLLGYLVVNPPTISEAADVSNKSAPASELRYAGGMGGGARKQDEQDLIAKRIRAINFYTDQTDKIAITLPKVELKRLQEYAQLLKNLRVEAASGILSPAELEAYRDHSQQEIDRPADFADAMKENEKMSHDYQHAKEILDARP
jgi:hypothetical protein